MKLLRMNRKIRIPIYAWVVIGVIGLLHYIPIFWVPEFLNDLYYNYKLFIISFCFILLVILAFVATNKKAGIITISIYLFVLIVSGFIRQLDNKILVWFNSNASEIEELRTPVLGYKKVVVNTSGNIHDVQFDVMFKFNDSFGMYEALIFDKNHGLDIDSFDGDYSLHEVYNENWWWYIKSD